MFKNPLCPGPAVGYRSPRKSLSRLSPSNSFSIFPLYNNGPDFEQKYNGVYLGNPGQKYKIRLLLSREGCTISLVHQHETSSKQELATLQVSPPRTEKKAKFAWKNLISPKHFCRIWEIAPALLLPAARPYCSKT